MINNNSKPYILILRDIDRASILKNSLEKNNLNVLVEPLYKIQAIKFKNINFSEYQALMLTSVNTIKVLSEKFRYKEYNDIKTYCVGKITEEYALEAGFNCIKTNTYSGSTLAKNVIRHSSDNNKKILLIGADVIAYDPKKIFNKYNLMLERLNVYKKIPFSKLSCKCQDLLKNDKIFNVVVYSPETAKIFLNLSSDYEYKNISITCLGRKTKKVLEKYNWKKIQVINSRELKSFPNKIIKSII
ncbi:MAG: hypothetical protein CFH33_01046 [Alphaproteobacteria bacterium MarineAlpha9_Bin3]|nr:MAG: hypothetical protein CFH33_01046 [Alphaproteobacteria bacterium MarineAlpha9_Bin3]|tara:strand:- start:12329 stop:13060 length:732 start_codon:yes stop_codon:yes gene_type:complete